ncbi:MAG: iron-containing alcohol dehydrogenase [Oscillospiraceae bacterium]|nr:iron-containing alcohol dehydrogenase [Oscillospiraceae bacterium]
MNILKKAYCRTYQKIFRMAIPVLPYRKPELYYSIGSIPALLKKRNIFRVLVVTDKFLHESGALSPMLVALADAEISVYLYDEVIPNPTVSNAEAARQLYDENRCEALIGFGGGSSIDCAKAVGARIARPGKSLQKMRGILHILKKPPFTVAVPTTAGTGSETTVTVVITDEATHEKYPISDLCLIPDAAVLDPEVTKTLPPHITATTGIDALTHAVEAYIGGSSVRETRSAALECIRLVFENIETAYNNGSDLTARKNMLLAANLGGLAFSKSYVGYCHAVAHTLGGKYGIPHGLANAVLLPYVLDFYGKKIHKKLKQLAVYGGLCGDNTTPELAARIFTEKVRTLNRTMGIPEKLSGICEEDIPTLSRSAAKEANPLYPVPVLLSAEELEYFYRTVRE